MLYLDCFFTGIGYEAVVSVDEIFSLRFDNSRASIGNTKLNESLSFKVLSKRFSLFHSPSGCVIDSSSNLPGENQKPQHH